jgi:DNA-binding beta-propeller fold protein YncE
VKNLFWTWSFISLLSGLLVFSCKEAGEPVSGNPAPSGKYQNGYFVVNEGNFGWGYGEISFIGQDGRVENEIFRNANNGKILGNVAQSMTIFEGKAYIVVNNSSKIEITEPKSMQSLGLIAGFTSPRYFCPVNSEKAYVTDLYANALWRVNPQKMSIEKKIPFDGWSEAMLFDGKKLWVTNMTKGNLVVFDVFDDKILQTIALHKEPNSIAQDADGKIWVLCGGGLNEQSGKIFVINPESFNIEKSFDLKKRAANLQADKSRREIYFLAGGLFKMNIDSQTPPSKAVIENSSAVFYGYTVKADGDILIADAKDYVQKGKVVLYEKDSHVPKKNFDVGVIPGFFCELAQ